MSRNRTNSSPDPVHVTYIGGTGRSGSTLLELLLGELSGFVSVGELASIWEEGVALNHTCGCGAPFHDCLFWRDIGERAFGGWGQLTEADLASLRPPAVARIRHLPQLAVRRLRAAGFETTVAFYGTAMSRLYRAIADASGAHVVVDSSNSAGSAFLLGEIPGIEPRALQLVRDPRGVAHSWTRRVVRPDVPGGEAALGPRPIELSSREWLVENLASHLLRFVRVPRLLVRYEDLVESPEAEVRRIVRFLGEDIDEDAHVRLATRRLEVTPTHAISGNPLRFRHGAVPIALDERWREAMPRSVQRRVVLRTLPLAVAYGYLRRRPTPPNGMQTDGN